MTTTPQDDACSQPGEVRSSAPLGLLPEQAGWAVEMHGECVLFANNAEKASGRSPGANIRVYTETQVLAAVAAERAAAKNRYHSTLDSMDAEIERLRAALQAIADDVCDNTYTRTARAALKPNV